MSEDCFLKAGFRTIIYIKGKRLFSGQQRLFMGGKTLFSMDNNNTHNVI